MMKGDVSLVSFPAHLSCNSLDFLLVMVAFPQITNPLTYPPHAPRERFFQNPRQSSVPEKSLIRGWFDRLVWGRGTGVFLNPRTYIVKKNQRLQVVLWPPPCMFQRIPLHPQSTVSRWRMTEKLAWSPSNRDIIILIHFIGKQMQHVTLTDLHLIFQWEHPIRLNQRKKGWHLHLYSIWLSTINSAFDLTWPWKEALQ